MIRRSHTLGIALVIAVACAAAAQGQTYSQLLQFGAITDIHHAQRPDSGSRFYSAALDKTEYFVNTMNGLGVDFVIELGDFKDQAPSPNHASTIQYLQEVEAEYQGFAGPTYHVLGNHDMDSISKADFQANVTNTGISPADTYYSWDVNGMHMVVLDANFNADGTPYDSGNFNWTIAHVLQPQIDWLAADLAASDLPTMVFVHQTLDRPDSDSLNVSNGSQVRSVLEADGDVLAAFSGHHHGGAYSQINGIHYLTLEGSVGGGTDPINDNAFSRITVSQNDDDPSEYMIDLQGYGFQDSRTMTSGGTPPPPTPAELLAYYPFDSATDLTDVSGNDHHGVGMYQDSSDPTDATFGMPGVDSANAKLGDAALRLQEDGNLSPYTSVADVSGQWVEINSVLDDLDTGDDVSISLWFKDSRESYSSYDWNDLLFGANSASVANMFRLGIEPGSGELWLEGAGDTDQGGFNDQQWHHVVLVADGQTGQLTLYVDGNPLTGLASKIYDWDDTAHLSIGMEQDGAFLPGDFFDGWIDDLGIWKGQLSADDVAYLYNGGAGRPVPEPAALTLLGVGALALLRRRR